MHQLNFWLQTCCQHQGKGDLWHRSRSLALALNLLCSLIQNRWHHLKVKSKGKRTVLVWWGSDSHLRVVLLPLLLHLRSRTLTSSFMCFTFFSALSISSILLLMCFPSDVYMTTNLKDKSWWPRRYRPRERIPNLEASAHPMWCAQNLLYTRWQNRDHRYAR